MRGTLGVALHDLGSHCDELIVMSADLGYTSGLGRFMEAFPEKFYNLGIAEENMVGVASGMAKEGFCVYATTFSNFLAMRSYEQIRLNMGYMNIPVKLVGVGSGFAMGLFGNTHYGIEDMALIRAIPNITLLSPADSTEVVKMIEATSTYAHPVYLRLTGGMNLPIVYREDYAFEIGKSITLREGDDVVIVATGTMVYNSLKAAEILSEDGISCRVINMHTIKPLDVSAIQNACGAKLIVTVEEHSKIGGLGGAVAEVLSELGEHPPLLRLGLTDEFKHAGTYEFMVEQYGLSIEQIVTDIKWKYINEVKSVSFSQHNTTQHNTTQHNTTQHNRLTTNNLCGSSRLVATC